MTKNIAIVNFNTQTLTEHLILSINKFTKDTVIYIFDNSDKKPFINVFPNVRIIDNTKSQIIDFDKWIKFHPRTAMSGGRHNKFASLKHCLSVQKCMDIIKDNFVLMDSDILLKKDISDLYDDNVYYSGEIFTQTNKRKRILPFICFINVNKCKARHIGYFNPLYMHGICTTSTSDQYDTGGGFYENTKYLPHKDIKVEDYCVHFGHGSWTPANYNYEITEKEFIELNKDLWQQD